jgi:glycosyltransferase involved in cell wall biosynthesis
VNGRFLTGTPTGLHRVSRALLDAARDAGLHAEVIGPSAGDPRVDRILRMPRGGAGSQLWEQVLLPGAARRRPLLSLANTAPVMARRGIVLVHDLAPLVGPQWFAPRMQVYGRVVFAAARRAELVLTVSRWMSDELTSRGIRAPVEVVSNAVESSMRPADDDAVARLLADRGVAPPYVLFVGWADPRKDVATAVAAHHLASKSIPHRLVLTGHAHPNFAPVSLPRSDSVVQMGYVDDEAMRVLLSGAAALVYPTRYEGFGLPPVEAWACGTPALVSDLPVLRESTQGRAVYVAAGDVSAWAEAMLAALRGEVAAPPPLKRTWADAGRELVQLLTPFG